MKNLLILFIVLIVASITASIYYEGFMTDIEYVQSPHDNRFYLVRNLPDKVEAAGLLSVIRARLTLFVHHLKKIYPNDRRITRLFNNFNPNQISESTPDSKYTSYSINKGEKIVFCVRQRNDLNELVDLNTMMFVAIHELSHLMTLSVGHTKEFWENMKFLLKEALSEKIQLYNYQPFHHEPQPYCGTMITDTPLKLEDEINIDDLQPSPQVIIEPKNATISSIV